MMKNRTKYFLMALICLTYSVNTLAQDEEYVTHPDTLRIDLEAGQFISLAFKDIVKSNLDNEFDSIYSTSINKIEAILKLDSHVEPVIVKLSNKLINNEMRDVVELTPIPQDTKVYMAYNKELHNRNEFSQVQFVTNDIAINIQIKTLSNLGDLSKLNLEQLNVLLSEKQKSISSPKKYYYIHTKIDNESFTDLKISDGGVVDFLTISAGIGAGLFRDKLAPEIAVNASVAFGSKHGITRHKMGLQTSFHYFFERQINKSYDMNINTFVTGYYKINFSKTTLKDNWMGLGVGYLARSRGDYFQGNTYKASIFLPPNFRDISIIPEIIITDDFKTVFPSIRFGLTF